MSASKPYAHAQYGKLVLVVVLVLRSKGPIWSTFQQPERKSSSRSPWDKKQFIGTRSAGSGKEGIGFCMQIRPGSNIVPWPLCFGDPIRRNFTYSLLIAFCHGQEWWRPRFTTATSSKTSLQNNLKVFRDYSISFRCTTCAKYAKNKLGWYERFQSKNTE